MNLGILDINNPGNIRYSTDVFVGEIVPSSNRSFKQFSSMAFGYRAMFVLIDTYYNKYGLKTIRGIISRYAPSGENNTQAYIDFVSSKMAVGTDHPIDIDNEEQMIDLVSAISWFENGVVPSRIDVRDGWNLKHNIETAVKLGASTGGLLVLAAIIYTVFKK